MLKRGILSLFMSLAATSVFATTRVTDCSTSDVQSKIDASSTGDTVTLPCTATWTSGVTISGKGINIVGSGSGRAIGYSLDTETIGTGAKTFTTVSTKVTGTPPVPGSISISNGDTLLIFELGFKENFMQGTVTSFSGGSLVMNITSSGGTCGTAGPSGAMDSNCKRWLVTTLPTTVITNNSTDPLFTISEATGASVTVSGIKFDSGNTNTKDILMYRVSSGRPILLHDNWFEASGWYGSFLIGGNSNRGVIYNNTFNASPAGQSNTQAFYVKDDNGLALPDSWTTVSTFGTADTTGENNFYFESNDVEAFLQGYSNWDDQSRGVARYNFFNNSSGASHGADTSFFGMRHLELYNNIGIFQGFADGTTANLTQWQFLRGGTMVAHDNVFQQISSTDYNNRSDFNFALENLARNSASHGCWGEGGTNGRDYYAPRQVGMGYVTGTGTTAGTQRNCTGTGCSSSTMFSGAYDEDTYVGDSEPVYAWNNHRTSGGSALALLVGYATPLAECTAPDSQANYIVENRDFFNTASTAKPGYTPYTYPHPLTGGSAGITRYVDFASGNNANGPDCLIATPCQTTAYVLPLLTPGDTLYIRAGVDTTAGIQNGGGEMECPTCVDGNDSTGGLDWPASTGLITVSAYPGETVWVPYVQHNRAYWKYVGINIDMDNGAVYRTDDVFWTAAHTIYQGFDKDHPAEIKNAFRSGIYLDAFGQGIDFPIIARWLKIHDNGLDPHNYAPGDVPNHGWYYNGGENGLIEYVEFYGNETYCLQYYSGSGENYQPSYNTFRNNSCHDGVFGLFVGASGHNNEVYNNLFYNNTQSGAVCGAGMDNLFYNNTFYANGGDGLFVGNALRCGVVNNISYGNGHDDIGIGTFGTSSVDTLASHNLTGAAIDDQGSGTTLTANITANPMFTDSSTGDFSLQAGSHGIAAFIHGVDLSATFTDDYLGATRASGEYDAGAIAYTLTSCVPDHLEFTDQPGSATLNLTIGTVAVGIFSEVESLCSSATNSVTLSKNGSATWGALQTESSLTKAAVAGIATWTTPDLTVITTAGSGSINAAASGLTGATSDSITISVPAAPVDSGIRVKLRIR